MATLVTPQAASQSASNSRSAVQAPNLRTWGGRAGSGLTRPTGTASGDRAAAPSAHRIPRVGAPTSLEPRTTVCCVPFLAAVSPPSGVGCLLGAAGSRRWERVMQPLAYHLIWTTYGTWLPGDARGWIQ